MDTSSKLMSLDEGLVELANRLLQQFHLPTKVSCVEDIGAAVFVTLYEGLCGDRIPGVVRHPITREDEIHNVQLVIDSLSADVLRLSLSHIRASGIVSGNRQDIANMLEIFSGLSEYILNKIESDISTDNDDIRSVDRLEPDDPDKLRPEVIDDILDRELQRDHRAGLPQRKDREQAGPGASQTGILREAWPESQRQTEPKRTEAALDRRSPPPALWTTESRSTSSGDRWADRQAAMGGVPGTDLGRSPGRVAPTFSRTYPVQERPTSPVLDKPYSKTYPRRDRAEIRGGDALPGRSDLPLDRLMQAADDRLREAGSLLSGANASNNKSELNTTEELIREGELWERRLNAQPDRLDISDLAGRKTRTADKPVDFDYIGQRPRRSTKTETEAASRSPGMAATMPPAVGRRSEEVAPERGRPATGLPPRHREVVSDRPATSLGDRDLRVRGLAGAFDSAMSAKGLSASYDDLQNLVERTAALARAAVNTSPIRSRAERDTSPDHSFHSYRYPVKYALDREDHLLARDLNRATSPPRREPSLTHTAAPSHISKTSPSRVLRKVSFLEAPSSSTDASPPATRKTSARSRKENIPPRGRAVLDSHGPRYTEQRARARYCGTTDQGYISDHEGELDRDAAIRRRFFAALDSPREMDGRPPTRRAPAKRKPASGRRGKKQPAKGVLVKTRKHLMAENAAARKKTDYLQKIYQEDLEDFAEEAAEELQRSKKVATEKEKEVKKKVATRPKPADQTKLSNAQKSVLVKKPRAAKGTVSTKARKHSSESGRSPQARPFSVADDEELMPALLEEFPYLHLSEHTWHELWRKGIHQIEQLTRAYEENKRKRSRAQVQVDEAEKKHQVLTHIVKKQLDHVKRVREQKEQKVQQVAVRNKTHEKRMQSARARKYYNEYQVRMRSKMLKRRTREEMIFKRLFQEGLAIQKQRIQDLRKYAGEQRDRQASQRQNDIASLENYYRDQFEMLADKLAQEKKDLVLREKAQEKMLEQMKRELKRKMESEIQNFQEQLFRDEDDAYFRQADADRVRHRLQMASYQTKV